MLYNLLFIFRSGLIKYIKQIYEEKCGSGIKENNDDIAKMEFNEIIDNNDSLNDE